MTTATKLCSVCRVAQALDAFNLDRSKPDGHCSTCRECNRIRSATWSAANRTRKRESDRLYYRHHIEACRSRSQRWREQHRSRWLSAAARYVAMHPEVHAHHRRLRRARLAGVQTIPFTPAELAAKVEYWGSRCWRCQDAFAEIDHVKPLAAGGPHILANLRPICARCNRSKRASWPLEVVMPQ